MSQQDLTAKAEIERREMQPCPFCPLMLPNEPEAWNTVGGDFFGEIAKIGDVDACGDCIACISEDWQVEEILKDYKNYQEVKKAMAQLL